jgi:very-short-patch-repair endonuclease
VYIKKLKFDFYLPNYNLCIEYDGRQHFEPIDFFGGEKNFEIIKKRDKIKNEYCLNNNIHLIRIPYNEYKNINSILHNEIKKAVKIN